MGSRQEIPSIDEGRELRSSDSSDDTISLFDSSKGTRVRGTEDLFLLHILQIEKGEMMIWKRQMLRMKVILSTVEKLSC